MFVLPTSAIEENYSFIVDLSGTSYELGFIWNERADAWFMDLSLAETNTLLVAGIKLTANTALFNFFVSLDAPPGRLAIFDSSGAMVDPGKTDLAPDQRCQLVYYTATEWAALVAGDDEAFEAATLIEEE